MRKLLAGILSIVLCSCLMLVAITCKQVAYAHPGGLDSSGGHKDNKNASGLGSYHYHCGDHTAHLHGSSGLCPYSSEYKAYKSVVDELKTYVVKATSNSQGKQDFSLLTAEDVERIETLLLHELTPFKLTEEIMSSKMTMFGKTNVKGLNVRKKQSTGSAKVCAIPVTGTGLLISQDMGDGWYSIIVYADNKSQIGYVKQEMVDLIEKPEYLLGLCEAL